MFKEKAMSKVIKKINIDKVRFSDIYIFLLVAWICLSLILYGTPLNEVPVIKTILFYLYGTAGIVSKIFILMKIYVEWECDDKKIILLLVLALISGLISDGVWISNSIWFLCGLKRINLEKILRKLFKTECFIVVIVFLLGWLGIIENRTMIVDERTVRYAMGFYHPNTLACVIFQLMVLNLCLKRKRLELLDSMICVFLGTLIYKITYSDTVFVLFILLGFFVASLCWIEHHVTSSWKNICYNAIEKMKYLSVVIPICSMIVVLKASFLTEFISGNLLSRLLQGQLYFEMYGFSLFGKELEINSGIVGWSEYTELYTLDNAYLYLILGYGIIMFVFFWIAEINICFKAAKDKNYLLLIVLSLYLIYGMVETYTIQLTYNFSLLYLGYIIWSKEVKRGMIYENIIYWARRRIKRSQ